MSFRDFIRQADESGILVSVNQPVSTELELAKVAHALDGQPVLFSNVVGYPGWRVS